MIQPVALPAMGKAISISSPAHAVDDASVFSGIDPLRGEALTIIARNLASLQSSLILGSRVSNKSRARTTRFRWTTFTLVEHAHERVGKDSTPTQIYLMPAKMQVKNPAAGQRNTKGVPHGRSGLSRQMSWVRIRSRVNGISASLRSAPAINPPLKPPLRVAFASRVPWSKFVE